MKTVSIPGTGISHVSETSKKNTNKCNKNIDNNTNTNTNMSVSFPTFKSIIMSLLRLVLCIVIGAICDFGSWIVIIGGIWAIVYFIRQCVTITPKVDE